MDVVVEVKNEGNGAYYQVGILYVLQLVSNFISISICCIFTLIFLGRDKEYPQRRSHHCLRPRVSVDLPCSKCKT